MKKIKLCVAMTIIGTSGLLYAQDLTTNNQDKTVFDSIYRANEFSIDAFASGSVGEQTLDHINGNRVERDGRLGAGLGVNYFFLRYVGVGADAFTENTAHNFIDNASGNLIGRLPIAETGIAPYIYGGAGPQFDEIDQTFEQAGGGIEFRFAKYVGFFVDARYVFANQTENYGVGRAGLRVNF